MFTTLRRTPVPWAERVKLWPRLYPPAFTLLFACLLMALCSSLLRAKADQAQNGRIRHFDIPPMPLADAVHAFTAQTGIEVISDATLVAGLFSGKVLGDYSPEEALALALDGTGLVAKRLDHGAISLETGSAKAALKRGRGWQNFPPDEFAYAGILQKEALAMLCGNPQIAPGAYRLVLQFWIAGSGTVDRFSLIGTTGSRKSDAILSAALKRARFTAPPKGLRQPATLIISPKGPQAAGCETIRIGSSKR